MAGLNLNVSSSVVKREQASVDRIVDVLGRKGWEQTGQALGGRIRYMESAGFNITLVRGPLATLIFPSGPVRGTVFGDDAVKFGKDSSVGAGQSRTDTGKSRQRNTGDIIT